MGALFGLFFIWMIVLIVLCVIAGQDANGVIVTLSVIITGFIVYFLIKNETEKQNDTNNAFGDAIGDFQKQNSLIVDMREKSLDLKSMLAISKDGQKILLSTSQNDRIKKHVIDISKNKKY